MAEDKGDALPSRPRLLSLLGGRRRKKKETPLALPEAIGISSDILSDSGQN